MMNSSMTDVAFELLGKKKKPVSFAKLWEEVSQCMGFSEAKAANKIASFYSAIMLDTRFASLDDNKWDLRSRRTYEETHPDTSALLMMEEDSDEEMLDEVEYDEDGNLVEKLSVDDNDDSFDE